MGTCALVPEVPRASYKTPMLKNWRRLLPSCSAPAGRESERAKVVSFEVLACPRTPTRPMARTRVRTSRWSVGSAARWGTAPPIAPLNRRGLVAARLRAESGRGR
eukprot:5147421-Alexandrium_andersonii.AAC.1